MTNRRDDFGSTTGEDTRPHSDAGCEGTEHNGSDQDVSTDTRVTWTAEIGGGGVVVLSFAGWGVGEPLVSVSAVRLLLCVCCCVTVVPLRTDAAPLVNVAVLVGAVISGAGAGGVTILTIVFCSDVICRCIAIIICCICCICCCWADIVCKWAADDETSLAGPSSV